MNQLSVDAICHKETKREMEKTAVKSELIGHGKRQMSVLEGEIMSGKCIKRRRRDSCGVGIGCKEQQVEQQKQQLPNQSVTTATTVKRSSRFRGVSRFDM